MERKESDLKVKKLIHQLGLKYNLTDKEVEQIVNSQFEFARRKIEKFDLTKEKKYNFIFKYLFKYYVEDKTINKLKEDDVQRNS